MRYVSRLWRILRFGLTFLISGAMLLIVGQLVVPLLRSFSSESQLAIRTQRALHHTARLFLRVVVALRVVDLTYSGTERLQRPGPLLVVANHPTLLDTPFFLATMPQVDNVVEVSWAESPIMRTTIAAADYLRNDDHKTIIENSAGRLRKGRRLLIFPEGSRSPAGSLHPFQRGAARIALASGSDILPVIIQCDPPVGTKGTKWYDVPDRRPRMAVRVVPPLSPQQHLDGTESPGVAARKVTAALQELYARELGHEDA